MSAEPGRTKVYSADLRWRVVWQRIAMGLSYWDIAQRLCISVGTAYNIFQIFEVTGRVDAKHPSKRPDLCKLDDHHQLYVITLVLDNPSLYLGESVQQLRTLPAQLLYLALYVSFLDAMALVENKYNMWLYKGIFHSEHFLHPTYHAIQMKCLCG